MNTKYWLSEIKSYNIKIKNSANILEYIEKYGSYRIIGCYGYFLKQASKSVNKEVTTQDLIAIFEFDKYLINMIQNYLFDFEQQLNNISIEEFLSANQLKDNYIFSINNKHAHNFQNNKTLVNFANDIYENVKSCNLIPKSVDVKQLPLKILATSWSFHTLISFISLQDKVVISNICKRFNLSAKAAINFVSACHSIRKFRNISSHNGIFFASTLNFYRREFNHLINISCNKNYSLDTNINMYKLIVLLEKMLNKQIFKKDLKNIFKKTKMPQFIKQYILNRMGIDYK